MKLSFQLFLFLTGSLAPIVSGITIPSPTKQEIYDIENTRNASSPGPLQFAVSHKVSVNPCNDGITSGNTWKLAVESPGATSLNFGFGTLKLSNGTKMRIKSAKDPQATEIEVDTNKNSSGEYWTQIFPTDKVDIFIDFSDGIICRDIELTSINVGFRGFGSDRSGSCNIDVVCPLRAGWEKEIKSVAGLSYGGSLFCTGTMINNMKEDRAPYFLTADHCGVGIPTSAASVVTYWNYETSTCGGSPDGVLNQAVAGGAEVIASNSGTDVTLLKLNNDPPSSYEVSFAGWDNTPEAYTLPGVCIHHPTGDEKRISFEYDPMTSTAWLGSIPDPSASFVRVEDWDDGTTEPGSSGSPLFNGNKRIIGQLYGGYAACSNDDADWYGRFSKSWTDNEEIRAALDPDGELSGGYGGIDTYDPSSLPTISPRPTNYPTMSPTCDGGSTFELNLKTDRYGGETTWTLSEQVSDNEVASGGPYESGFETEYVETECINAGCYNFDIFDSFGDGICCGYGEGSYSISVNENVVGEGGEFGISESTEFCTGPTISPSPTNSPTTCDVNNFELSLNTDDYGSETTWTLNEQDSGDLVLSGGGYSSNTVYAVETCLNPGCYEFVIFDTYGDGLTYGGGSYSVSIGGVVVVEGGDFGFSESTEFCTTSEICEDAQALIAYQGNAYTCAQAAQECSNPKVASHCPLTCNACSEYQCSDSQLQWVVNVGDDIQVGNCNKASQYAGACEYDFPVIASTCRELCNYCA